MRLIAVAVCCVLSFGCASVAVKKQMRVAEGCRADRQYFKLEKPLKAKVIMYRTGSCFSHIAASTVVTTSAGDTIMVVEFCGNGKFSAQDSVLVMPVNPMPTSKRTAINFTFDCKIKRTCYGVVSKINK